MVFWSRLSGTKLHFTQPVKTTLNAFVKSFYARLRDTCLNRHWFKNLTEARRLIGQCRIHYNVDLPHSSLSYKSPIDYERKAS